MNENEIARVAAMGHALRPDWPLASLVTLLSRHELATKSRRDVAVALAWVACESETTTPARVIESGPWWRAANVEHPDRTIRRPPRRHEECRLHAGEWADFCRACVADRKAHRDDTERGHGWTPDRIRSTLRAATVTVEPETPDLATVAAPAAEADTTRAETARQQLHGATTSEETTA